MKLLARFRIFTTKLHRIQSFIPSTARTTSRETVKQDDIIKKISSTTIHSYGAYSGYYFFLVGMIDRNATLWIKVSKKIKLII